MPDFDYSIDAKNVLNKFYDVERIVYVEGEDDIPFWEIIFEKIADYKVEVESVGGKPELLKLVEPIFTGEAEYLVAMDSDFDAFKNIETHQNIIKTLGYSIENTLVSSRSLAKILKMLARMPSKDVPWSECSSWLERLDQTAKQLAILDVVNELGGHGVKVVLENSDRFMVSKTSCELCAEKIAQYIGDIPITLSDETISDIDDTVRDLGLSYLDVIRGHFIFSAALRFIRAKVKKSGKKISISVDAIYSNMLTVFENIFDQSHPHFFHYKMSVEAIRND